MLPCLTFVNRFHLPQCKPSAIVSYSVGPWGGSRVGIALRPMLSELGTLSVSKMVCLPSVSDMLNEDGTPKDPANRMLKQLPAMMTQLNWHAVACADMKAKAGMY